MSHDAGANWRAYQFKGVLGADLRQLVAAGPEDFWATGTYDNLGPVRV